VNPNNIGNVRPVGATSGFQQPPTIEDGVRLAVNNVKAYPGQFNNGQPMSLLQIGERWAPRGDGANDPVQWAKNVASIGGLPVDQPLDFNNPQVAAAFARGVHGAEKGANAVQPVQFYQSALTGGGPSARDGTTPVTQGDGNVAQAPADPTQGLTQLPPGAKKLGHKGQWITKDGRGLILLPNGEQDWVPLPKEKTEKPQGPAGTFAGNAIEAQYANILEAGAKDPAVRSTFAYAQAYAHFAAPRTTVDENNRPVTIQPNVSHIPPPTFAAGGAAPQTPPAGSAQPSPAPSAPSAPAQPGGAQTTQLPGGQAVTVGAPLAPRAPGQTEMAKFRDMQAEGATITNALNEFLTALKGASTMDRAKSMTGANTPLNTSFNKAALLAKGEALFNLGVLNGPDLDIIRRTLPDPSSWKSGMVSDADAEKSVKQVIGLINDRLAQKAKVLGIELPKGEGGATPDKGDLYDKYGLARPEKR
jgi:hypothetical protein